MEPQDEIIKVPPAYIVSRYTAQTTLKQCPYLKAVDFTNGTIGIQVEAGIDYADTAVKYLVHNAADCKPQGQGFCQIKAFVLVATQLF